MKITNIYCDLHESIKNCKFRNKDANACSDCSHRRIVKEYTFVYECLNTNKELIDTIHAETFDDAVEQFKSDNRRLIKWF